MLEDIVDDFDLNFCSSCCYFEKEERKRNIVMNEKKKGKVYLYGRMK
jgi:hypothetical protein